MTDKMIFNDIFRLQQYESPARATLKVLLVLLIVKPLQSLWL